MNRLKLVVIAVQAGYLEKITGQLNVMFGSRIDVRSFQLGKLDKEHISHDEVVFSAIPNMDRLIKASFPEIGGFIKAKRSINLVNTGPIMSLEKGSQVLVVGDHEDVTNKVIHELKESEFEYSYIPFHPGMALPENISCAVTTGEVELVPDPISQVINIGLRVISFQTMKEINQTYELGLTQEEMSRQYILSLVHVSSNWPVSQKNKYISTWIGTRQDDHPDQRFDDFIAKSQAMRSFISQAQSISRGDHPVHIDGAIGVGKRRVAIAIHNESSKSKSRFYCVNCTSEGLNLEESLFGLEDDTGVLRGLIETADNSTLCIEEIETMPLDLQERLATFLTDRQFIRKGGEDPIRSRVRIITTSTLPLTQAFSHKRVRQSLYHHLSLHVCTMPSLASRKEDFDQLIRKFILTDLKRPDLEIEPEALQMLKQYSWEGNVQEFYNVIYHLACLGEKKITRNMLPFYIYNPDHTPQVKTAPSTPLDTEQIVHEIESTGFLDEYLQILEVYFEGKKANQSFGRAVVIERLKKKGPVLTKQKLRRKQEHLNELGLLKVMKGRAGTTISRAGEDFLSKVKKR